MHNSSKGSQSQIHKTMRVIDSDKILIYVISVILLVASVPFFSKFRRTRGKNVIFHAAFAICCILTLIVLPESVQREIYSPGGVVVVGTLLPVSNLGRSTDQVILEP